MTTYMKDSFCQRHKTQSILNLWNVQWSKAWLLTESSVLHNMVQLIITCTDNVCTLCEMYIFAAWVQGRSLRFGALTVCEIIPIKGLKHMDWWVKWGHWVLSDECWVLRLIDPTEVSESLTIRCQPLQKCACVWVLLCLADKVNQWTFSLALKTT